MDSSQGKSPCKIHRVDETEQPAGLIINHRDRRRTLLTLIITPGASICCCLFLLFQPMKGLTCSTPACTLSVTLERNTFHLTLVIANILSPALLFKLLTVVWMSFKSKQRFPDQSLFIMENVVQHRNDEICSCIHKKCWSVLVKSGASSWNTNREGWDPAVGLLNVQPHIPPASEFISSSLSPKTQVLVSVQFYLYFQNICRSMSRPACCFSVLACTQVADGWLRWMSRWRVEPILSVHISVLHTVSEMLQTLQLKLKTLNKENCHWFSFQAFILFHCFFRICRNKVTVVMAMTLFTVITACWPCFLSGAVVSTISHRKKPPRTNSGWALCVVFLWGTWLPPTTQKHECQFNWWL